jgi:hypothetical protein
MFTYIPLALNIFHAELTGATGKWCPTNAVRTHTSTKTRIMMMMTVAVGLLLPELRGTSAACPKAEHLGTANRHLRDYCLVRLPWEKYQG